MLRLGITGSIGSGKSTATKFLKQFGPATSNSDSLARELLYSMGHVRDSLVSHFGMDILDSDGGISRQNLAKIVFEKKRNQVFINNLIHPLVRQETILLMDGAERKGKRWFIVDAPLMFESGLSKRLDKVLVITAPDEQRIQRVFNRTQMSEEEFRRRDSLQMPQNEKSDQADFVIINDGSIDDLSTKTQALHQELLDLKLI